MNSPLPTTSLEPTSPVIGTRLSALAASGETHRVRVPTFLRRVLKVKHLVSLLHHLPDHANQLLMRIKGF